MSGSPCDCSLADAVFLFFLQLLFGCLPSLFPVPLLFFFFSSRIHSITFPCNVFLLQLSCSGGDLSISWCLVALFGHIRERKETNRGVLIAQNAEQSRRRRRASPTPSAFKCGDDAATSLHSSAMLPQRLLRWYTRLSCCVAAPPRPSRRPFALSAPLSRRRAASNAGEAVTSAPSANVSARPTSARGQSKQR